MLLGQKIGETDSAKRPARSRNSVECYAIRITRWARGPDHQCCAHFRPASAEDGNGDEGRDEAQQIPVTIREWSQQLTGATPA